MIDLAGGEGLEVLAARCRETPPPALLVVTGAGISHASGIPTFRGTDPNAVWSRDVMKKGTAWFFAEDPVESWRFYHDRFTRYADATPNDGHRALATLERWHRDRGGRFMLVTQNVDALHEQAGSTEVIHIHGSTSRVRCAADGCTHGAPRGSLPRNHDDFARFATSTALEDLPTCPACGTLLRPHVLWFDEVYDGHEDYEFQRAMRFALTADLVVFIGTSFSVGITELVLQAAERSRATVFSIDPAGRIPETKRVPEDLLIAVAAGAEIALPALATRLGAST